MKQDLKTNVQPIAISEGCAEDDLECNLRNRSDLLAKTSSSSTVTLADGPEMRLMRLPYWQEPRGLGESDIASQKIRTGRGLRHVCLRRDRSG